MNDAGPTTPTRNKSVAQPETVRRTFDLHGPNGGMVNITPILKILTLNCRESAALISVAQDRELGRDERCALRLYPDDLCRVPQVPPTASEAA